MKLKEAKTLLNSCNRKVSTEEDVTIYNWYNSNEEVVASAEKNSACVVLSIVTGRTAIDDLDISLICLMCLVKKMVQLA